MFELAGIGPLKILLSRVLKRRTGGFLTVVMVLPDRATATKIGLPRRKPTFCKADFSTRDIRFVRAPTDAVLFSQGRVGRVDVTLVR